MNEREESESESVLLYHCPTCGATHLDPVEDAENAALRQQLAEARTEVERLQREAAYTAVEYSTCPHCGTCVSFEVRGWWIKSTQEKEKHVTDLRNQLADQAAELERLREAAEKSVAAFEHYQMTCREHRSPYIKENGRRGASPYAELVESCQDIRAALSPSDKENNS